MRWKERELRDSVSHQRKMHGRLPRSLRGRKYEPTDPGARVSDGAVRIAQRLSASAEGRSTAPQLTLPLWS